MRAALTSRAPAVTHDVSYELPCDLLATAPPERRGIPRDQVRLLVSRGANASHHRFFELPRLLKPGDVLVVNDSAMLPCSLAGRLEGIRDNVRVHLSSLALDQNPERSLCQSQLRAVVELRTPYRAGTRPYFAARRGDVVELDGGAGRVQLRALYRPGGRAQSRRRLWEASLDLPGPLSSVLDGFGSPIRYDYAGDEFPLADYHTTFGRRPGSVEMPSAARPFTPQVVDRLQRAGVELASVTLHTGVSSQEADEPPFPEWFSVGPEAVATVRAALVDKRRVIAVGTTVVRAVTAAMSQGRLCSAEGWTDVVIQRGDARTRIFGGLLTGMHAPRSSHLAMLSSFVEPSDLVALYRQAIRRRYLWHEFGDSHLILRT